MASVKTIRRTACILGALSVLILGAVLWSDSYMGFDPNHTMSVREAWDAGLIQGFIVLNLLLGVSALGVWQRPFQQYGWARFILGWQAIKLRKSFAGDDRHDAKIRAIVGVALYRH